MNIKNYLLFQANKPSFELHPHVEVSITDVDIRRSVKKSEKIFVKVSVGDSKSRLPKDLEEAKLQPEKLFYEDVDRDRVIVEFSVSKKSICRTAIPMKDFSMLRNSAPRTWVLCDSDGVNVGNVTLSIKFVNRDRLNLKDYLMETIEGAIFKPFFIRIFDDLDNWKTRELRNFDYFVEIEESKEEEPTNMFLLPSKVFENRSWIRFNGSKAGAVKIGSKTYFKLGSLTNDAVEIKLFQFDLRSTSPAMSNSDDEDEKEDVPEQAGDFEKMLNIMTTKLNLGPSNAAKSPAAKKRRAEYFKAAISAHSIPWKNGLKISKDEFTWTVRLVGGALTTDINGRRSEETFQHLFNVDEMSDLVLLCHSKTLTEDLSKVWNGQTDRTLQSGIVCLGTSGRSDDWEGAEAESVFSLQRVSILSFQLHQLASA